MSPDAYQFRRKQTNGQTPHKRSVTVSRKCLLKNRGTHALAVCADRRRQVSRALFSIFSHHRWRSRVFVHIAPLAPTLARVQSTLSINSSITPSSMNHPQSHTHLYKAQTAFLCSHKVRQQQLAASKKNSQSQYNGQYATTIKHVYVFMQCIYIYICSCAFPLFACFFHVVYSSTTRNTKKEKSKQTYNRASIFR